MEVITQREGIYREDQSWEQQIFRGQIGIRNIYLKMPTWNYQLDKGKL